MTYTKDYPLVKVLFILGTPSPKDTEEAKVEVDDDAKEEVPEEAIGDDAKGEVPDDARVEIIDVEEMLVKEQNQYCDLVQFDFVDHESNKTLAAVSVLKFALGWNWWPQEPDFLVVTDDNGYINIPLLWGWFYEEKAIFKVCPMAASYENHDSPDQRASCTCFPFQNTKGMFGHVLEEPSVVRPSAEQLEDRYVQPAIVPTYLLDQVVYPRYISPDFYLLPWSNIECLYATAMSIPLFHLSEVHLAYAADACGIPKSMDMRINRGLTFFYISFTLIWTCTFPYTSCKFLCSSFLNCIFWFSCTLISLQIKCTFCTFYKCSSLLTMYTLQSIFVQHIITYNPYFTTILTVAFSALRSHTPTMRKLHKP